MDRLKIKLKDRYILVERKYYDTFNDLFSTYKTGISITDGLDEDEEELSSFTNKSDALQEIKLWTSYSSFETSPHNDMLDSCLYEYSIYDKEECKYIAVAPIDKNNYFYPENDKQLLNEDYKQVIKK